MTLGNRTGKLDSSNEIQYIWDDVNRLVATNEGSDHLPPADYLYRADGMRVRKNIHGSVSVERTFYDGQMPVESDKTESGTTEVTKNFLGARGIEGITTVTSSSTSTVYPLYDTHGNMVATLSKDSTGSSWSLGNQRSYDVWGGVRTGSTTGGPKGRYCANLGHVQDDESGLVYMRARYYEPSTGRFVSEDRQMQGINFYVYVSNTPLNEVDYNGNEGISIMDIIKSPTTGVHIWVSSYLSNLMPQNNPFQKMLRILVHAVLQAIGAIQMFMSIAATDKRSAAAYVGMTITALAATVLSAIALKEVLCIALLLEIGEDAPMNNGSGQSFGESIMSDNPPSIFGF